MTKNSRRLTTLIEPADAATATTYEAVEISVSYQAGGLNYFTYKTDPSGYCLLVLPVTVEKRGTGFTSISHVLGSDKAFKVLLDGATRFNAKKLVTLYQRIVPFQQALAAAVAAGNKTEAFHLVTGAPAHAAPAPDREQSGERGARVSLVETARGHAALLPSPSRQRGASQMSGDPNAAPRFTGNGTGETGATKEARGDHPSSLLTFSPRAGIMVLEVRPHDQQPAPRRHPGRPQA